MSKKKFDMTPRNFTGAKFLQKQKREVRKIF